ncbi:hypothetical protein [Sporomusa sp. KB1]|jgi:membrane-anchored glycerophosphoryl diester phosphodiesterase (GDPDase)|uniref:hypothetical protein n=1 Tax=Sporomusa sp. KB1 TaxID=943346 RepID=UPI0011A5C28E|nr:hypothetical protein [Sporomusa sp. KB1]TWH47735.1 hypothetical protein Salpa_3815 [Sporomusa sp. KB1]
MPKQGKYLQLYFTITEGFAVYLLTFSVVSDVSFELNLQCAQIDFQWSVNFALHKHTLAMWMDKTVNSLDEDNQYSRKDVENREYHQRFTIFPKERGCRLELAEYQTEEAHISDICEPMATEPYEKRLVEY